jgi:hypothetical protein
MSKDSGNGTIHQGPWVNDSDRGFDAAFRQASTPTPAEMIAARESRDWAWRHIAVQMAATHTTHDGNVNKLLRAAEHIASFIRLGTTPKAGKE